MHQLNKLIKKNRPIIYIAFTIALLLAVLLPLIFRVTRKDTFNTNISAKSANSCINGTCRVTGCYPGEVSDAADCPAANTHCCLFGPKGKLALRLAAAGDNKASDIYLMDNFSSSPEDIISSQPQFNQQEKWNYRFSSDGTKLLFNTKTEAKCSLNLRLLSLENGSWAETDAAGIIPSQLKSCRNNDNLFYAIDDAVFSPDGTKIAFSLNISQTGSDQNDYYLYIYEIGNKVLSMPVLYGGSNPSWSGDSQKIAFELTSDSNNTEKPPGIYILNVNQPENLISTGVTGNYPLWYPQNNKYLLFLNNQSLDGNIYYADLQSHKTGTVKGNYPLVFSLSMSSSGRQLAFEGGKSISEKSLYLADINNLEILNVPVDTKKNISLKHQADNSAWSVDGEWFAFADYTSNQPGCYIIRNDGKGLSEIKLSPGYKCWDISWVR